MGKSVSKGCVLSCFLSENCEKYVTDVENETVFYLNFTGKCFIIVSIKGKKFFCPDS